MERANKIISYRKEPSLHRMVIRHSDPHTAHSFFPPDSLQDPVRMSAVLLQRWTFMVSTHSVTRKAWGSAWIMLGIMHFSKHKTIKTNAAHLFKIKTHICFRIEPCYSFPRWNLGFSKSAKGHYEKSHKTAILLFLNIRGYYSSIIT